jgi:hypothetical protein
MAYDSTNLISSRQTRYNLDGANVKTNSPNKNNGDVTITVTMRGTTPAAHADAILRHFGISRADEQAFKEKYGYDLRQSLADNYSKNDNAKSHYAVGGGNYRDDIPISGGLVAQIKQIKSQQQPTPTVVATPSPNQVFAERNGYDQSVQTRNQIERNLPSATTAQPTPSPTPQPHPTPTPVSTAILAASNRDVSQMSLGEKLQIVFTKTLTHLGPEAAEKFKQLLTPENIAIMVGTTAALVAVQGVPFLDVAVDAVILGVAAYSLGSEAISVIGDLVNFATETAGAKTEADLDSAAQSLAKATATVGVDALAALLIHKGVKSIKGATTPPPNTRVVEMLTPEGVRVRVRVPIEEAVNPQGSNVLESRANNSSGSNTTSAAVPREAITTENVGRVTVPGVRGGQFASWFNSLSRTEMDALWSNRTTRVKIESALRNPGGFHEWLPVSRAPKFRQWGVTAEQIWEWRSSTTDLRFVNPEGRHGGAGSTTAHNEIFALVDRATSFAEFKTLMQDWATRRLPNGVADLPEGLRR